MTDSSLSNGSRSDEAVKVSLAVVLPDQLRYGGEDDGSAGSLLCPHLQILVPAHHLLVLLVLQVVLLILLFTQGEVLVGVILIILVAIVYFLYHIGYIMVLHNIMDLSLDDGNDIN